MMDSSSNNLPTIFYLELGHSLTGCDIFNPNVKTKVDDLTALLLGYETMKMLKLNI